MPPVIQRLQNLFPELIFLTEEGAAPEDFDAKIKALDPSFYAQVLTFHPIMDIEYGLLCNQISTHLAQPEINEAELIEQVKAGLVYAELLEELYAHYLIVPKEVLRFRKHQRIYQQILNKTLGFPLSPNLALVPLEDFSSFSRYIRNNTAVINWFRLLLSRSKRVLNLIDTLPTSPQAYNRFISVFDQYANPFFMHLAWCFFVPRFLTNLFLLLKHSIPGPWMKDQEKAINGWQRFLAQLMRRGFELSNDIVWIIVGLLNLTVFIGLLAPVAIYASLFAFAFDVINVGLRTCIELNRLSKLKAEYRELYSRETTEEGRQKISEFQTILDKRIEFEKWRLAISFFNVVAVLCLMCLSIPVIAANPILPFIGACLLIAVWIASYALTQYVEKKRPTENVEQAYNKSAFFTKGAPEVLDPLDLEEEALVEPRPNLSPG